MKKIVNVTFRDGGKVSKYICDGFDLKIGDMVMAETPMGDELGHVVEEPYELDDELVTEDIIPIMGVADSKEIERYALKQEKEREAYDKCLSLIEKHQLDMNLIDAVFSFDGKKVIFFFTSDNRVDFRELVKDLVASFRARIELRQIGSRDQAKLVGGVGICGRELCCCTFLEHFAPVTLRMAREQNLSLNPSKLNGACGRLMCCLQFEKDAYADAHRRMPKVGKKIRTPDGVGLVNDVNLIKETVAVKFTNDDSFEIVNYAWSAIASMNSEIGCDCGACPHDVEGCDACPMKSKHRRDKDKSDKSNRDTYVPGELE